MNIIRNFFFVAFMCLVSCNNKMEQNTYIYSPIIDTANIQQQQVLIENNKIKVILKENNLNISENIIGLTKRSDVFEVSIEFGSFCSLLYEKVIITLSDKNGRVFDQISPFLLDGPVLVTSWQCYKGKSLFRVPHNMRIKTPLVVTAKATWEWTEKNNHIPTKEIFFQVKFK